MIVYFDTSAIVPIVIEEPSTVSCQRLWKFADQRLTSRLTYIEVAAALAMAERLQRITTAEYDLAWRGFGALWRAVSVVEVSEQLAHTAARSARKSSLRGYDAAHFTAATMLRDPEQPGSGVVAASGDTRLLNAWIDVGVATYDTKRPIG